MRYNPPDRPECLYSHKDPGDKLLTPWRLGQFNNDFPKLLVVLKKIRGMLWSKAEQNIEIAYKSTLCL